MTFLEGHFITPTIVGRRLALNALAVFIALAFWTWLWGPMGAFLSSPLLIVGADPEGASDAGRIRRNCRRIERFPQVELPPSTGRFPRTIAAANVSGSFSMSMTNGEAAMRNLTDKATYERLEKDVTAVKNDIAALTDQITDALNSFAGTATKQARRGYKQARANAERRSTTCRSAAAR